MERLSPAADGGPRLRDRTSPVRSKQVSGLRPALLPHSGDLLVRSRAGMFRMPVLSGRQATKAVTRFADPCALETAQRFGSIDQRFHLIRDGISGPLSAEIFDDAARFIP